MSKADWLELARKISRNSTAIQQKMAAVVVRGGKALSVGTNHKMNHAEARALRPHRDFSGATIYVSRWNGRCSRPCDDCQAKIRAAGVIRMVYVDWNSNLAVESISGGASNV